MGFFDSVYLIYTINKNEILIMKKLKTEEFIEKSKKIHGDKYDYSLVEYTNTFTKVEIICQIHGVFEQTPHKHTQKQGCSKCNGGIKSTKEEFIVKSKEIHGNKYDYSLVEYNGTDKKVKIICEKHGIFEQTPHKHLSNRGCHFCSGKMKLSKEQFIEKSKKVHGDKYDYSLVDYNGTYNNIKIICPEHGIFEQKPTIHYNSKCGCPICNESHGEKEIKIILDKMNINYERQKKFDGCRNIHKLPFDFYLTDYNICIEFDGKQHFEKHYKWGEKTFERILKTDKIKNEYCKNNNIHLIRIKYDQNIYDEIQKLFVIYHIL